MILEGPVCLFPDVLPDERILFPLVQIFRQIVYLSPIENEALPEEKDASLLRRLFLEKRLHPFTPVPLGQDRERFLALARELHFGGRDTLVRLSLLTLGGLGHQRQEGGNTLLSALRGGRDRGEDTEAMLLWQSRLILQLGALYDTGQREARAALQGLSGCHQNLFAQLRGDEGERGERGETPPLAELGREDEGTETMLRHRLRAWTRLFFRGGPCPEPAVFVCAQPAVLDTLGEAFEKNHHRPPERIAEFSLPQQQQDGPAPETEEVVCAACDGEEKQKTPCAPAGELAAHAAVWAKGFDQRFPAARYGRCTLRLYLFPGIAAWRLFSESFAPGDAPPPVGSSKTITPPEGSIVGLLTHDDL